MEKEITVIKGKQIQDFDHRPLSTGLPLNINSAFQYRFDCMYM